MANASEIQALLRFLTKDAKIPLAAAMGKVKDLQKAAITSPEDFAKADIKTLEQIFGEDKVAKQAQNAAKRVKRKASAPEGTSAASPKKRQKNSQLEESPAEQEESLALPAVKVEESELSQVALITNRAPLVLAFAVVLLKYTMPEQPLSSRLSLGQAVVSVNSRSKAVRLGIESSKSAEEEGWGQGQPVVKIMGRDIRVLKRWGYQWKAESSQATETTLANPSQEAQALQEEDETPPALWGLDLEAFKNSSEKDQSKLQLPIYTPSSARAYLMKSFTRKAQIGEANESKAKTAKMDMAAKERSLAMLLQSLDILYASWSSTLDSAELNRRAWAWYVRVRPDVEHGVAGWGGRGEVKLSDILDLRRTS